MTEEPKHNIRFLKFQIVWFFGASFDNENPIEFFLTINKKTNDLFEKTPILIPLPEDAPKEIPLLQAKSENNIFKFHLTKDRASFFYIPQRDNLEKDFDFHLNEFDEHVKGIFAVIEEQGIKRIGYNTKYFLQKELPAKFIEQKFISNGLSGHLKELNIRFNIPFKDEFLFNNIASIDPAKFNGTEEGIQLLLDINTIQEQDYDFNKAKFEKFMKICKKKNSFKESLKIMRVEDER